MLPLAQMHQMVPVPNPPHLGHIDSLNNSHLNHLASFQSHQYLALHHHLHHSNNNNNNNNNNQQQPRLSGPSNPYQNLNNNPSQQQRAFAIRSSQAAAPSLHRITTSFNHGHSHAARGSGSAEYSLRRKTPNGTIDNGYDGSLAHLPSGPPPLKHVILPASSNIFPTAVVQQPSNPSATACQLHVPASGWPYSATAVQSSADHPAAAALQSAPCSFTGWDLGQAPVGQDHITGSHVPLLRSLPQQNYHPVPTMQLPAYHQNASPTVFSPPGIQPSPSGLWRDAGASDYRSHVSMTPGFAPHQNAVVDSALMPAQPTIHAGLANGPPLGHTQPFRMHLSSHLLDDGFSRHLQGQNQSAVHFPHRSQDTLSLVSAPGGSGKGLVGDGSSQQARFKERALAQAHKAYTDLLNYVNHSKRVHHGKLGSSGSRSSRMVVYPKPPRQLIARLNQCKPRPSHAATEPVATYSQQATQGQSSLNRAFTFAGRPTDPHSVRTQDATDRHPPVMAEVVGNPNHYRAQHSNNLYRLQSHDTTSPMQNAKNSLEMLSSLCEHSGWKWVDGMLLGGCLHYGLEHYEDALEWFKRIISLDQSHVEAISNIAATLYCLNRQEEAEQHWWQAVKLRPSYLEAVEHLVGLLSSSQRNQEAVNTIDFVQNRLRVAKPGSALENVSETASETDESSTASGRGHTPDSFTLDADKGSPEIPFSSIDNTKQPGFGSSGYAIPGSENGRMLLLIHAKGNMLYGLKDIYWASEAFEEAVLISIGRQIRGVQPLIRMIQTVLAPRSRLSHAPRNTSRPRPKASAGPLLLPPEKAKHTAQLVFASSGGHLPGLRYISESPHKKSVISTTSNCLLSLAKIFQDAMSNGGASPGLMRQPAGVGDILALYYLSLSLQESPSTANNVGILLASVQQASQHVATSEVASWPSVPGIIPGSGLSLALAYYHYGLSLDSKHVHLHTNLGSLLKDIGQLDSAIQMYEKAVQCDGTFDIALTNLANAVKDRGRINDAIIYYKRAVHANPDFAEAVCGLSTALNSVCDWRDRGGVVLYSGRYDRWHVDEEGMFSDVRIHGRGSGLMQRVVEIVAKQLKDSSSWGCGTLQEHTRLQLVAQLRDAGSTITDGALNLDSELRRWAGRPWEGSRVLRLVERSTRAAMRCWYQDLYVNGNREPPAYLRPKLPASLTVPSAPTVLPFHTFTCPLTARDIRMISQRNALRISCSTLKSPWLPAAVYEPPKPPSPHLNIGYVSSDFNNHPLAHLMQSVFGFHDQRRAKAFCYATTASDRSVHREQIEQEAPVFRDVSTWGSDRLVEQIVQDGIHILVNLNGYTRGARNEIFAARPVPIQMSFMGFAGTLGAEWCDYLLADATAIPPSTLRPHRDNLSLEDVFRDEAENEADDWIYSENIIFCRDTFFCCDHAQSADPIDERRMTWEQEQRRRWKMRKDLFPSLPGDTIILGNFNQLYKIDPTTFRTWLRILAAVPKAVLWLLRFPELGERNLKRTAKLWAGDEVASRIIFTDVAQKREHIARARVCDLFLDTPECNAHTTAADVLWSSTPLLTLPRYQYKMCSRMAASILKGALPRSPQGDQAARELIAADDTQYEEFAIKLAGSLSYSTRKGYGEGSGRLAELRKLLWESKWTCALFDTRRWVRDLEDAYDEAWRRWVAGEGGDIYL